MYLYSFLFILSVLMIFTILHLCILNANLVFCTR